MYDMCTYIHIHIIHMYNIYEPTHQYAASRPLLDELGPRGLSCALMCQALIGRALLGLGPHWLGSNGLCLTGSPNSSSVYMCIHTYIYIYICTYYLQLFLQMCYFCRCFWGYICSACKVTINSFNELSRIRDSSSVDVTKQSWTRPKESQ